MFQPATPVVPGEWKITGYKLPPMPMTVATPPPVLPPVVGDYWDGDRVEVKWFKEKH